MREQGQLGYLRNITLKRRPEVLKLCRVDVEQK